MSETLETLTIIRNLLESQRLAVLSTQNHGQPYCNLIAIAAADDLKYLLFATTRATRKYANLMADSRVAVLVDNRRNDPADFTGAAAPGKFDRRFRRRGRQTAAAGHQGNRERGGGVTKPALHPQICQSFPGTGANLPTAVGRGRDQ